MVYLVMGALFAGCGMSAFILWIGRYSNGSGALVVERLGRLRTDEEGGGLPGSGPVVARRRRTGVQIGRISVVPTQVSARWAGELSRAGLTLQVKEYFIVRSMVGLLGATGVLLLFPWDQFRMIGTIGAFALGFAAVGVWVGMRVGQRRRRLEAQLVELLPLLSSGLRSGFGLIQAIDNAGNQMTGPLQIEIRRLLRDVSIGASVEAALQAMNERVGSPDFDIAVTAIMIQRSVGGNLAEILDSVAHTMRERERIRGEIRTLTSQQRLTGYVLGGIPVALFGVFYVMNPDFTSLLITDPLGRGMLLAAMIMEVIGFAIISRIVNIEV